jgi:MGT family glycosyltransferase
MARIAVAHIGFHGHLRPLARASAALVAAGHQVTAFAPEEFRSLVEVSGVTMQAHNPMSTLSAGGESVSLDGKPLWPTDPNVPPDHNANAAAFAAAVSAITAGCALDFAETLLAADVEMVIFDSAATWGRVAADAIAVPRVMSRAIFPSPLGPSYQPPHSERIAELHKHSRDLVAKRLAVDLGSLGDVMISQSDSGICFTISEIAGFDYPSDSGWEFVGAMIEPAPEGQTADPDDPRPLVYMALGTVYNWKPALFKMVADALAELPLQLLISTGGFDPAMLGDLPANASAVPFVDSRATLARASLHISHGGANSVAESLLAGVPMLFVPQGADQAAWASRVETLSAGRVVAESAEEMRGGVEAMLHDDQARRGAHVLGRQLAECPGVERLRAVVEAPLPTLRS